MAFNYEIVNVNGEEVHISKEDLKFDETTLTQYFIAEGGFYNYLGGRLRVAEAMLAREEITFEELWGEKFRGYKDEGGSDKYAEARTNADSEITAAKLKVVDAKLVVGMIQSHMRAFDKNHENAQSLGHFLRKEMEKLNSDIRFRHNVSYTDAEVDQATNPFERTE